MADEETIECAMCGRVGEPPAECALCHGRANTQVRAFTRSEEVSNRVPEDQKSDRYSRTGAVGPKIANLPGSGGPGGS